MWETHNKPCTALPRQGVIIIGIPVTEDTLIPPPFDLKNIPRETGTGGRLRDIQETKKPT